jgi:hypothetical protein
MGEPSRPREGELRLARLNGEWTAGRMVWDPDIDGLAVVTIGSATQWPASLVEEWGPEISTMPHPIALVPDPDMLADAWAPRENATYQARAGEPKVADLIAVTYRLAYQWGFFSGRDTGFAQGFAEATVKRETPKCAAFEGELGDGTVTSG